MAIIECTHCGHKVIRSALKTMCSVCNTPYPAENASYEKSQDHDSSNDSPSSTTEERASEKKKELVSPPEDEFASDEEDTVENRIFAAIDEMLQANYWEEVRAIIEEQQELLLAPASCAFLTQVSQFLRQSDQVALAEHVDMYVDIFIDAYTNGIEIAWQHFMDGQQQNSEALQALLIALIQGVDIQPVLAAKRDRLLAPSIFAALHRAILLHSSDATDIGKTMKRFLRVFEALRRGETLIAEQIREMLGWNSERNGEITFFPGVPGIRPDDPQLTSLLEEGTAIAKEHFDLFSSLPVELARWLEPDNTGLRPPQIREQGKPQLRKVAANLLKQISYERYPQYWAMISTLLESLEIDLDESPSSSEKVFNADPEFSREKAPEQWVHWQILQIYRRRRSLDVHNEQQAQPILTDLGELLSIISYEQNPMEWMAMLGVRSSAYLDLRTGNIQNHTEQAIKDLDTILKSIDREKYVQPWAMTIMQRCHAYVQMFHITGQRRLLDTVIEQSTEVISFFEHESSLDVWAEALQVRGIAYVERYGGEEEQNVRRAIEDFELAMTYLTKERDIQKWAEMQINLGIAHSRLLADNRQAHIEQAIQYLNTALQYISFEESSHNWIAAIGYRGIVYQDRIIGDRQQNQERALRDFSKALEFLSNKYLPYECARMRTNRGSLYLLRIKGEKRENLERAIVDYTEALHIFTRKENPVFWALVHIHRGSAYRGLMMPVFYEIEHDMVSFPEMFRRILSKPDSLLEGMQSYLQYIEKFQHFRKLALEDIDMGLAMLNPVDHPLEYAFAQRERAMTLTMSLDPLSSNHQGIISAFDEALTTFAKQGKTLQWAVTLNQRAASSLHFVQNGKTGYIEQILSDLHAAHSVIKREIFPVEYLKLELISAQLWMTLQDWAKAHLAWQNVRSVYRDLLMNTIDTTNSFELMAEFAPANIYIYHAQVLLQLGRPDEAAIALEEGHAQSMRTALALDMLTPETISDPAARVRANTFLQLLTTWRTLQQGVGETVQDKEKADSKTFDLSALENAYSELLRAMKEIRQYDNPDFLAPVITLEQIGRAIVTPHEALVYLTTGVMIGDQSGIGLIVTRNQEKGVAVRHVLLSHLSSQAISNLFVSDSEAAFPIDVDKALKTLGHLGMNDIASALLSSGKIQKVRLIAYGRLGRFPLPSVVINVASRNMSRFNELFEVTLVPGARAAEIAHEHIETQRSHVLIAGNPQPLSGEWENLPYAAAEAEVCYHLARKHRIPPATIHYLSREEATKKSIVAELQRARYAHLALHGSYKRENPKDSRLVLAGDEHVAIEERTITLGEVLNRTVDLVGLRLLVLSACETSVFDIRRAPDELMGLATGFLQAGTAGVIATLWNVSDRATYLLMSRFVDLYFDQNLSLTPAQALARAQYWLRNEATCKVLESYQPNLLAFTRNQLSDTHKILLNRLRNYAAMFAEEEPNRCIFADPKYWAAFIMVGC